MPIYIDQLAYICLHVFVYMPIPISELPATILTFSLKVALIESSCCKLLGRYHSNRSVVMWRGGGCVLI